MRPILLVMDMQLGVDALYKGEKNNPKIEDNIALLLDIWRTKERPIIHIQHHSSNPKSPLFPGEPTYDFIPLLAPLPGEMIIKKSINSAFIRTNLLETLNALQPDELVVVGMTTNHCVSATVKMASNLGFKTTVVYDGTAAYKMLDIHGEWISADLVQKVIMANLDDEFATIRFTKDFLEG